MLSELNVDWRLADKITATDSVVHSGLDLSQLGGKNFTFLNGYSYLFLRDNNYLENFDYVGLDGFTFKWIFSMLISNVERHSFDMTSLAPLVFNQCINHKLTVYFIGSTEDEIQSFIKNLKSEHSTLSISGFRNGYFASEDDESSFIGELARVNPDVLIVGMGTPRQELFLLKAKEAGWNGVGFTCGGFIHQAAEAINYYPYIVRKTGFRWLYRMYKEPKVIKRVFKQYPFGLVYFFIDLLYVRRKIGRKRLQLDQD